MAVEPICYKCRHCIRIEQEPLYKTVVICEIHGKVGKVVFCRDFKRKEEERE